MSKQTPTFDPNWTPIYRTSDRLMNHNQKAFNQQLDHTTDQVETMTQIINSLEQRCHELESRLTLVENTERVLESTSPVETPEKRGPGRPRKSEVGAE